MRGPNWHIIFFNSRSRKIEFRLTPCRSAIYAIACFSGLLLVAASTCLLLGFGASGPISRVDAEFAVLCRSLELAERRLSELEQETDELVFFDEKIRVVSDLESINEEVRSLGIGGTDWHLKEPEMVRPRLGNRLALMGERIEKLKRQTRFERESYEEIVNSLRERERRLAHTPSVLPARGFITSYYGWRKHPLTKQSEFHRGIDVANLVGTPVVAVADGRISFAGWKRGFGRFLEIDHGYGYVTRYGHLKSILVRVGDRVFRGQTIGLLGSSGNATGPHVHYEVLVSGKHTNPKAYIRHAGLF